MYPGRALHLWDPLLGHAGQQPLDLHNGEAGVEALGTGHRTVQDRVAPGEKFRIYGGILLYCAEYVILFCNFVDLS